MTKNYLDILAETIRKNWDQPALTDFYLTEDGRAQDTSRGNHYTYGEMYAEIVRVADLLTHLGLQKGDHIAICGANSAHWVIAYLAIAKMQGIDITILHTRMLDDIIAQINFADAKTLFVDFDLWQEFKSQSLHHVKNVIALDNWSVLQGEKQIINRQLLITSRECGFDFVEPGALAMICFTSGTTNNPKGIMLSYHNLSNNIFDTITIYPRSHSCNILSLFPFGHMLGLHFELLTQLCLGKKIFISCVPKATESLFNAYNIVRPYAIASAPALLKSIVDKYKQGFYDLLKKDCKYVIMGGAKLNEEILEQMLQLNICATNAYGMSETGAIVSGSTSETYKYPSCGKVLDGNKISIASNGEILVKGENVMLGYYKDSEATAQKIDNDGWLHTGDKGYLDEDGYLYVEGRLEQDIIVLPNGENIRPDNIESLINALPKVSESIVLARDGKLVARVVVPSSLPFREESEVGSFRRSVLRAINPQLPLFSQLYDVEITDIPLQRTEKMTIKRYLYK